MLSITQFEESYLKLLHYFTGENFRKELLQAQKEFFENAGTVDENKPNYILRMNQFYDWFFLTRPLVGYQRPPVQVCDLQRDLRMNSFDLETIEVLKKQKHSVFEFVKIKKNEMVIKDLFVNEKATICVDDLVFSFDEKEYFEARYIEIQSKKYFLKSFCFHPETAQKFINEQIKKYKKNPDLKFSDFLYRLNKMRYKFEQYRHVKPEMIYTEENKLGL